MCMEKILEINNERMNNERMNNNERDDLEFHSQMLGKKMPKLASHLLVACIRSKMVRELVYSTEV